MKTTTTTRHSRAVQDGIRKFWRDYETRHNGSSLVERVADLEELVEQLIVSNNHLVAFADAHPMASASCEECT
jgi:hypothetical protein